MADHIRTTQDFHAQQQSPLLSLPPKLRNTIYELVLGSGPALWSPSMDQCHLCNAESDVSDLKLLWPHRYESVENTVTLTPLSPQWHTCSSCTLLQYGQLSFLLTCRQVYFEAEMIFYRLNHIRYDACGAKSGAHFTPPFILTLSMRRQMALRKVTMTAPTMSLALEELEELLLPIATDLHTLYLELQVQEFWYRGDPVVWATRAGVALRNTKVTRVKVVDYNALGEGLYSPGFGSTGNLAAMIEEMLMSAIGERKTEA